MWMENVDFSGVFVPLVVFFKALRSYGRVGDTFGGCGIVNDK